MKNESHKFAAELRATRKRLGLTQSQCAAVLGVSKRTLENWEDGRIPLEVAREGALARLARWRWPLPETGNQGS